MTAVCTPVTLSRIYAKTALRAKTALLAISALRAKAALRLKQRCIDIMRYPGLLKTFMIGYYYKSYNILFIK